jgi:hypothetical protein
MYVPNVSSVSDICYKFSFGCCKTRSGCYICMQVFLYLCCKCFILTLQFLHTCFQVFCDILQMFRRMLQVFQLFRTYVASVSSRCYKSRSDVTHVTIRVRSGDGTSGPCARSGGAGPRGCMKCKLGRGARAQETKVQQSIRLNVQALALQTDFLCTFVIRGFMHRNSVD